MLISCRPSQNNTLDKAVFRMNIEAGLSSLDPAFARNQATIWMTAQLFNGLVALDSNLNTIPAIAHSWDISPNATTYTFNLRPDVKFHKHPIFGSDSTRTVTAHDFVYSFTRICDKATASTGKWVFKGIISGLEEFDQNSAQSISGFQALNDSTLQIQLTKPFPPFLSLLAMPYAYVVPQEIVNHYKEDFSANAIGTGPFTLFNWQESNFLIFHKNPHYFESENGQPLPYLDAVHVSFMTSRLTAFIEFVQGKLDFINSIDESYKDEILSPNGEIKEPYRSQYQVIRTPQLNTEYLGFQLDTTLDISKNHPLSDPRIRQALNYAIDREKLVKYHLNGMGYPGTSGFMPKGIPGHNPQAVPGYAYNPQKARQLLKEAGYPGGKGLPTLVLNSNPNYAHISQFVQKAFDNIGVKLSINNMEGGALRKQIYGSKINFWRASWIADYPDGQNYLSLFYTANHAPNGPNTTHFSTPQFDQLYEQALTIPADSARIPLYHQMEQEMLQHAPVIILYYDRILRIISKDISGLTTNPMNHLELKKVKKALQPEH